ncbi:TetR/AcrR family transcriptional regulator [Glycomyces tarimensis]
MVDFQELPARSARKRQAILQAARAILLRKGYDGTSMDEIAAQAEVSKQTIYKHFANKERLFTVIITEAIELAEASSHSALTALADSEDVATDLRHFARDHLRVLMDPQLVRMRRIIIGEAERFPALARSWYDKAPQRAAALLGEQFQRLDARGLLRVDDPSLAAHHFNWLVLSIPLNKAMFYGDETGFGDEELNRFADEGVRVFLARYGVTQT